MHQVGVEVVEAQVGEGLPAGRDDVAGSVLVVPELGGDPELIAGEPLEDTADLRLVFVDGGAVEVPVADLERAGDGLGDLVGPEAV